MKDVDGQSDECERVAFAITDGRFLEDPSLWRPHVESCAVCRGRVEGLFFLRECLRQAQLTAPAVDQLPAIDGARMIETAFRRFHRGRRIRNTSICVVLALLAAIGTAVGLKREAAKPEDPVAYARGLHRTVFGGGSNPDFGVLRRDEGLRAEYVKALDHPSSLVRRTALSALLLSGVALESRRLETVLTEFRETLDSPLEVASTSDGARELVDALESRRVATLRAGLLGLQVQAEPGMPRVASSVILPFLSNVDGTIREYALKALTADPAYQPGGEVTRLLESDPDAEVRHYAAVCLVRRLGDRGASLVIGKLRASRDDDLELRILPVLAGHAPTLSFSTERTASAGIPAGLALAHARVILRSGVRNPPDELIGRALQTPTAETFLGVTSLASEGDWPQYRDRLQEVWRGLQKTDRTFGGGLLVLWDVKAAGDEKRAQQALEICEADRDPSTRESVAVFARSGSADVRQRALGLLEAWPQK